MASIGQSTAGVQLWYGLSANIDTDPESWVKLPNITGYPDLVSDPNTADVTPLSETSMVINIPLLMDIGILAFPGVMTPELVSAIDAIIAAQTSGQVAWFKLEFPAPLDLHYYAPAEYEDIYPTGTDANNAVTCSVRLTPKAAPKRADNPAVS